ncbi:hypothetical protein L218DRAFT_937608 [Marasmius fiardii PR-910]|nr:hypothetical protein L218DRAFT_937608 [Marasmius fiardii PR-910]
MKLINGLVLLLPLGCTAAAIGSQEICPGQVVKSETFIGANHNVKVEFTTCPQSSKVLKPSETTPPPIECGTSCENHCFTPSGGGPDPNECHVIADALRFDDQNVGTFLNVTNEAPRVILTYGSCVSFFQNQATGDLIYCRKDWADILDDVAFNCQAPQNAHGGLCVAFDGLWFIQVQPS